MIHAFFLFTIADTNISKRSTVIRSRLTKATIHSPNKLVIERSETKIPAHSSKADLCMVSDVTQIFARRQLSRIAQFSSYFLKQCQYDRIRQQSVSISIIYRIFFRTLLGLSGAEPSPRAVASVKRGPGLFGVVSVSRRLTMTSCNEINIRIVNLTIQYCIAKLAYR